MRVVDGYLERVLRGEAFLVQDGAMGTMLQRNGMLQPGMVPETLNVTHPEAVTAVHRAYVEAGAQMVVTNTFGANAEKLGDALSVEEAYRAAVACARAAGARYVAGDIGPTGALLEPLGDMPFERAYDLFFQQARAAEEAGCDVVMIETIADLREAKAAVLAAREATSLPVFVSMTFGEDGRTFLGTPPEVAALTLSALGADVVGANCSLGPVELRDLLVRLSAFARCPVSVRPNAGLPRIEDGATVFDVTPEEFGTALEGLIDAGATVLGGCCGTDPRFTARIAALVADREGAVPCVGRGAEADGFCIASAQQAVVLPQGGAQIAVIGERINPTGKPKLKAALRAGDLDYLVGEAVAQQQAGADVLDVNVGLPEIDEPEVLRRAVEHVQGAVSLPLQIDSSDPVAIEAAARAYVGKPLINSVNGKASSLAAVLPVAKRYGCAVVGLTLDEDGIPPTAEGRLAIARRIVEAAEAHGVPRCDVAIDCLAMAAATNQAEAREILRAIALVKQQLGVRTVLGVSNISFGLPQRGLFNAAFLSAAFGAGLDMPILNPLSARYRDAVAAWRVVNAQDAGAVGYIERYAQAVDPYEGGVGKGAKGSHVEGAMLGAHADATASPARGASRYGADVAAFPVPDALSDAADEVREAVAGALAGRKAPLAAATRRLLADHEPLSVVNGVFVPALDLVGRKYDRGEFFLPQLMASAEAVKAGFDEVRERMGDGAAVSASADQGASGPRRLIVLATVEGDIHDIGKNIARMLLENYGFEIVDLGRDVPPEAVVAAVREHDAHLLGLSALMTTTVKAMERTVSLLRAEGLDCAVMVGGAVLTPEYAAQIGADFYAKDAAEGARIATRFFEG